MAVMEMAEEHYRWYLLVAVIIGSFMSILDSSIVNIALPKMMSVFSVNTSQIQWVGTAYALAMGVIQPSTAYLGKVCGQKKLYIFSLIMFTIGSLLCAIAWSNNSMIFFRVIQAIGGGIIMPVSLSLVYIAFPPQERGLALGIWGISATVAPTIGPTLGGYLLEHFDWPTIFTINIPIGVFGVLFSWLVLKETEKEQAQFDWIGFLAIGIALFCLILGLSKGQDEGWHSVYIVTLFTMSAIFMLIFIAVELYHPQPLLDISLFTDLSFAMSNLITIFITIILFGAVFLLPIFMENMQGYTAMQTGLIMFPQSIASGLMMPLSGRLTDRGYGKAVTFLGLLILALGTWGLLYLDLDTSLNQVRMLLFIRGIGLGLCMMPSMNLGFSKIPLSKMGSASSISNVVRQIASAFGIAFLASMLERRTDFHLARLAESLGDKMVYLDSTWLNMEHGMVLLQNNIIKQANVFAFDDCFMLLVIFCLTAFVATFFLPAGRKEKAEL